jgi:2-polyprenyl-3-methyl-5-hydroxy-6-metoxy-1,4-benzoquinol methylase
MILPCNHLRFFDRPFGRETTAIVDAVLDLWPEHAKFLRASFEERSQDLLETTEMIATLVGKIATQRKEQLANYAADYRYLCEKIVYPEELFFRREGRYRLSTFAEAAEQVYNDASMMSRYMNCLLVSDALWLNHASAMNDFARAYLPESKVGGRHLEIGPGHGMLLHLAIEFGRFDRMSAWDVSATSIDHTREVLAALGQAERVDLHLRNLYSGEAVRSHLGRFDTIVLSEVLEHLEQPHTAIEIIRELLAPGGTVWINVPTNGPAPDHLFLLRSPQELEHLVIASGLHVARKAAFPVTGSSLERAIRQELPISCIVVGKKVA